MTTSGDPGAVAKVAAELLGTPVTMVESSANLHGMPFPAELMARARSQSAAQSDG
jgi:hypothetical protein